MILSKAWAVYLSDLFNELQAGAGMSQQVETRIFTGKQAPEIFRNAKGLCPVAGHGPQQDFQRKDIGSSQNNVGFFYQVERIVAGMAIGAQADPVLPGAE